MNGQSSVESRSTKLVENVSGQCLACWVQITQVIIWQRSTEAADKRRVFQEASLASLWLSRSLLRESVWNRQIKRSEMLLWNIGAVTLVGLTSESSSRFPHSQTPRPPNRKCAPLLGLSLIANWSVGCSVSVKLSKNIHDCPAQLISALCVWRCWADRRYATAVI